LFDSPWAKHRSTGPDIQAQNFAGLAFGHHFHGPAADFAIGGKPLRRLARINEHFKFLAAKWTLNHFRFLHTNNSAGRDTDSLRAGQTGVKAPARPIFRMKRKNKKATQPKARKVQRVRAREKRAASNPGRFFFLNAIIDSIGEAIFSQNLDGVITTWNAGARQLFGYTAAEAVGQSAFIMVPDALRPATAEMFKSLRAGPAVEHLETVRVRKDGVALDVYLTISPIKGPDGRWMGAASIAYDITERKRIEGERTKLIAQLNDTLSKVRTLSGLLPICASCKMIRDDQGYWQKLETFVHEHSNAEFSHSICPECMARLYPDFPKPSEGPGQ
jgi:PAS domain S-box-containing protein